MKNIMANKPLGFRVTLVAAALSLVTALVYLAIYSSSRYMSWQAFGIMIAGVVLSVVLIRPEAGALCTVHAAGV